MTYASIIIPTHNRDQLLARAVNSALGQTVGEIEVIVVDDGCTDQTAEVMEVFKRYDPRVIYLQIPSALGLSGGLQRNEAIKIARGEFICYLDDDDVMTPWSVEGRGSFLEGREDLDFCWGRTLFIRNNVNHPDLDNLVTTRLVEKAGRGKEVHWVEGTILPDEFMHRSGVVGERSGIWWSSGRGEDRRLLQAVVSAGYLGEPVESLSAIYGRTAPYERQKAQVAKARMLTREHASADARGVSLADTPPPAPTRLPSGLGARMLARAKEEKGSVYARRSRKT